MRVSPKLPGNAPSDRISRHPEAPDGTTGDIRDLLVQFGSSGYVIRYQVMRDQVVVLAVRHMREAGY